MKYAVCSKFWIEGEVAPGLWDTDFPRRAGCSTFAEVAERLAELRALEEPWRSMKYRVVDQEGREVNAIEALG